LLKVNSVGLTENDNKPLLCICYFYWSGAMIGRFVGSYLTRIMKPGKVLRNFFATIAHAYPTSISVTDYKHVEYFVVGLFNSTVPHHLYNIN
jgi:FHS family L-fucose permease-like MFS transporter